MGIFEQAALYLRSSRGEAVCARRSYNVAMHFVNMNTVLLTYATARGGIALCAKMQKQFGIALQYTVGLCRLQ